jgi:hypothetical protein
MKKIAICIVSKGNLEMLKFCVENSLQKTSIYANYFFNCDDVTLDYCNSIAKKTEGSVIKYDDSLAKSYNQLLLNDADYYVIFPINIIVNNFWLEDLINTYESVENCGVLSIKNSFEKLETTTILHKTISSSEDILKIVYKQENNFIDGILFFHKSILENVGKFDLNCQEAFFKNNFSWRSGMMNYQNFYIKEQQLIELPLIDEKLNPVKTYDALRCFKKEIEHMFKNNEFIK